MMYALAKARAGRAGGESMSETGGVWSNALVARVRRPRRPSPWRGSVCRWRCSWPRCVRGSPSSSRCLRAIVGRQGAAEALAAGAVGAAPRPRHAGSPQNWRQVEGFWAQLCPADSLMAHWLCTTCTPSKPVSNDNTSMFCKNPECQMPAYRSGVSLLTQCEVRAEQKLLDEECARAQAHACPA